MKKYRVTRVENRQRTFHNCPNLKASEACLGNKETNTNEKWTGQFSITPRTGPSKHGQQILFQFSPSKLLCSEPVLGKNKTFEFYESLDDGYNHMRYICDYIDNNIYKKSNDEKIQQHWTEILKLIGDKPNRKGLEDTPKRIAKMYKEIFRGYDESQKPKVTTFDNGVDGVAYDEMICDEGDYYSHCEHHLVPFFGKYIFAYIPHPKGKILGISKVARVVDFFSAKLQIQERLVHEVVEYLWEALCQDTKHKPLGMALIMKGEHLCKTMRGAKKKGQMTCSVMKGDFKDDSSTRAEFLRLIK